VALIVCVAACGEAVITGGYDDATSMDDGAAGTVDAQTADAAGLDAPS